MKELFLPDVQFFGWYEPEEEPEPDPWARPDLDFVPPCEAGEEPFDPFGGAYEPCVCCGAESIPENPCAGYICPCCGWEIGDFTGDEDAPSDLNRGLSLWEARLNLQTFGAIFPEELCTQTE